MDARIAATNLGASQDVASTRSRLRRGTALVTASLAVLAVLSLTNVACAQVGKAAEPAKVVLGSTAWKSANYWDTHVAIAKGYFKDNGINVVLNDGLQPTALVTAVASGDVQIACLTVDTTVLAASAGAPVTIVAGQSNVSWSLMAEPGIKSFDQLRGKRVGVSDLTGSSTLMLLEILQKRGLTRNDVQLIPVGGTSPRYAALTAKAISATLLTPPLDLNAADAGFNVLTRAEDDLGEVAITVYTANTNFAKSNRPVMVNFIRAVIRAQKWINDPANREEAIDILANVGMDRKAVERSYDNLFVKSKRQFIANDGRLSRESLDGAFRILGESVNKTFDQAKFTDWSFWQTASGK